MMSRRLLCFFMLLWLIQVTSMDRVEAQSSTVNQPGLTVRASEVLTRSMEFVSAALSEVRQTCLYRQISRLL
jgi:hypothetical protein